MKKLSLILLALAACVNAAATFRYIDNSATGTNAGTSMTNAFQSDSLGCANVLAMTDTTFYIIRRTSNGTYNSISTATTGGKDNIQMIITGMPRNGKGGRGDFVQGSNVIGNVSYVTDLRREGARAIKDVTDGRYYTITALVTKITLSAQTVAFARWRNVVGGTSAATGKIQRYVSATVDTMWVVPKTGTFTVGETITSVQGGSGTVGSVTTGNGYIILNDYTGTSANQDSFYIDKDPYYDRIKACGDPLVATWTADSDSLPSISFNSNMKFTFNSTGGILQCLYLQNGGGANGGILLASGSSGIYQNLIVYQGGSNHAIQPTFSGCFKNCLLIGTANGTSKGFQPAFGCEIINCSAYNWGSYGLNGSGTATLKNVSLGVELDNGDYDISMSNLPMQGYNVRCGGRNGKYRTSSDDSYFEGEWIENDGMSLGANTVKTHSCTITKINVAGGTDPVQRIGGSASICRWISENTANLVSVIDDNNPTIWSRTIYFDSLKTDTIKMYLQDSALGNLNASDSINSGRNIWLEAIYPNKYVNDSVYNLSINQNGYASCYSTSSSNPIANRANSSDWNSYLKLIVPIVHACNVKISLKSRLYGTGTLFIDPKLVITHN
jgi:hypothetical protein